DTYCQSVDRYIESHPECKLINCRQILYDKAAKTYSSPSLGGADVFPDGLGGQPQPPPAAGYRIVHLAPSLVERLQPPLPVPADPLGELGGEPLGGDLAPVPPVEELDLEPAEEPLAGGVVRRVPLARHRPLHPGLPAGADPVGGAVVPAAVAVEREAAPGGGHGAGEHLGHERLGRRGAH